MPAVTVTVKKLVWLQLYPFLCKFAQPYIQCVADFFKNGSVYVLDCEAGLWRCTHADLAAAADCRSCTCAPVGAIFAIFVHLTKEKHSRSSLLLLLWEWPCVGCWYVSVFSMTAHFPLGGCCLLWHRCTCENWRVSSSCTRFSSRLQ